MSNDFIAPQPSGKAGDPLKKRPSLWKLVKHVESSYYKIHSEQAGVKVIDTPKITKQKSQEKLTFSFGEKSEKVEQNFTRVRAGLESPVARPSLCNLVNHVASTYYKIHFEQAEVKVIDSPKITKQKSQEKLTFSSSEKSEKVQQNVTPVAKPAFNFGSTASPAVSEQNSGFTFGKLAEKPVEEDEAPKLVGAFCSGSPKATDDKNVSIEKKSEGSIFGFGKSSTGAAVSSGFGGLASGSSGFAFGQRSHDKPAFGGGEVKQIGQQNSATATTPAGNDPDGEYDPHYEALVTLKEVKVDTGEENEVCLFSERSKLYMSNDNAMALFYEAEITKIKSENTKQAIIHANEMTDIFCTMEEGYKKKMLANRNHYEAEIKKLKSEKIKNARIHANETTELKHMMSLLGDSQSDRRTGQLPIFL